MTGMHVPILDLRAQHARMRVELEQALMRVLDSGRFILGPEVEALERELAAQVGVRHGIGVSSGTDALLAINMALGLRPGDEVVTTPFTFFATAGCIARLGAIPVFVDLAPGTFHLDPARVELAIGPKTRAVVAVHLFGGAAAVDQLAAICSRHGVPLIEDAAQGLGARAGDRCLGSFGKAATLSFFPSKNLGALGDGGMVLCDDDLLADRLRLLRDHGARPKYHHIAIGGNFRLDALQAAVLRVKLLRLERWIAARRRHAALYRERLAGCRGVALPADQPGHSYHHFVLRARERERLRLFLTEQGIQTEVYYPEALHLAPCFASLGYQPGDLPEAEAAVAEAVAIPVHPELTDGQIDHVARQIRAFYGSG